MKSLSFVFDFLKISSSTGPGSKFKMDFWGKNFVQRPRNFLGKKVILVKLVPVSNDKKSIFKTSQSHGYIMIQLYLT